MFHSICGTEDINGRFYNFYLHCHESWISLTESEDDTNPDSQCLVSRLIDLALSVSYEDDIGP